jgi:hypothetical protein
MKISQLNQGLLIAGLLSSSVAFAEEYPASNFQPKVIYSSDAVTKSLPATSTASSPCEPKAGHTAQAEQTPFDARYPASSFQPKVVFSN